MADDVTRFFDELARRDADPLLSKIRGSARFDLVDGGTTEHWRVTFEKGRVTVDRDGADADCIVTADRTWFARLTRGEENAMAAVLRGTLEIDGDIELMFAIQRAFPGPTPDHRAPADTRSDSR
jgi:putative sterol carrier protein